MKKLYVVIIAGIVMFANTFSYADDSMSLEDSLKFKSQCELFAKKCVDDVDIINKRIKDLESEINKGTKKYKPEQIEQLKYKLEELNQLLDNLDRN